MKLSESGSGIEACALRKTLRKRTNIAIRQIQLDALNPVHGKENYTWRQRPAIFEHSNHIIERSQFNPAEAESFRRQSQNCAPELVARIAQRDHHHGARLKGVRAGITISGILHPTIVAGAEVLLQL